MFDVGVLFFRLLYAPGTLLPHDGWRFVATDMEVFCGEDVHHFVDNILHKLVRTLLSKAQHIFIYAPAMPHFVGSARTSQFGISSQSGQHVARHVYLGDNGDVALACIFHNLARLLLRVETAVRDAIVYHCVVTDNRSRTH